MSNRERWARAIERVRRIYEIREECEAVCERIKGEGGLKGKTIPREVYRMLFTDWDRALERVWKAYDQAHYEAVMYRRLFDDVTLNHEFHVCEGVDGWHESVDPDGSVHRDCETYSYSRHRYASAEHAEDALWLITEMGKVVERYEDPGCRHWATMVIISQDGRVM